MKSVGNVLTVLLLFGLCLIPLTYGIWLEVGKKITQTFNAKDVLLQAVDRNYTLSFQGFYTFEVEEVENNKMTYKVNELTLSSVSPELGPVIIKMPGFTPLSSYVFKKSAKHYEDKLILVLQLTTEKPTSALKAAGDNTGASLMTVSFNTFVAFMPEYPPGSPTRVQYVLQEPITFTVPGSDESFDIVIRKLTLRITGRTEATE